MELENKREMKQPEAFCLFLRILLFGFTVLLHPRELRPHSWQFEYLVVSQVLLSLFASRGSLAPLFLAFFGLPT